MKPIPVKKRSKDQPFVIVGCIIEKNDQFLLVQEAKKSRGLWNQPAGWLDNFESIAAGAKREAEEETGLKIRLTGFLGVYSLHKPKRQHHAVKFIFSAKPLTAKIKLNPSEIMDAKWFTLEEIRELKRKRVLRDYDIINEVEDFQTKKFYPIKVTENIKIQKSEGKIDKNLI
ncbi:NUDIX domain-containing protein [Patescibacteria group bacterium]|nr:NUDIX domain-containing protein [Patescibacteria group bacterium]